jgi:rhodanese-related sulfurtransferase
MEHAAKRAFKVALYEQFARITKALASGRRLEIIDVLAQGERTVEQLAQETGMSIANVSQHLKVLRAAQLVDIRRKGLFAFHRLSDQRVFRTWQAIRDLGQARLADLERVVDAYLGNRKALQAVTAQDLVERMKKPGLVILDVRPDQEYRAGHIRGARSIPVAELKARLKEVPRSAEVVAYCRGPYCVFADEAVELLHAQGYKARRLALGLPDWKAMGLPVESHQEGRHDGGGFR